jgi:hypothetical protein
MILELSTAALHEFQLDDLKFEQNGRGHHPLLRPGNDQRLQSDTEEGDQG